MHPYKVLRDWPSARDQIHLEQRYNSEHGIHLGDKLWKNQQYIALKVYKKLGAKSGAILEDILEWDGSFEEFTNEIATRLPLFLSSNLDAIGKELVCSAKSHHSMNKHHYIMNLLDQPALCSQSKKTEWFGLVTESSTADTPLVLLIAF